MFVLLAIVGLVASASAKDLVLGQEGGELIFKQNVTAGPTIWQQVRNITINASDSQVITRVEVVDNREDKNGEAAIVDGGIGHKNVTIELKSPTIFRGFDFVVQVYAKTEDGVQRQAHDQQNIQEPSIDLDETDKQAPNDDIAKGLTTSTTHAVTQKPDPQSPLQHPVAAGKDQQRVRLTRDTFIEMPSRKKANLWIGHNPKNSEYVQANKIEDESDDDWVVFLSESPKDQKPADTKPVQDVLPLNLFSSARPNTDHPISPMTSTVKHRPDQAIDFDNATVDAQKDITTETPVEIISTTEQNTEVVQTATTKSVYEQTTTEETQTVTEEEEPRPLLL